MTWCKLHSQILDSRVFLNEGLLKVWIYCLCRANIGQAVVEMKTGRSITEVELAPGQFVFGRNQAAKKLGMSPSTVWKRINKLKMMGNVDIKSDSHYSIVSICNWSTYQSTPNGKEHQKEQASDNQVTTKEQPSDTGKIYKKDKSNIEEYILSDSEIEEIYNAYPRKVGRAEALRKIKKAGKTHSFEFLIGKVREYAKATSGKDKQYIPHPKTWFHQERFNDDPSEWRAEQKRDMEVWT